MIKANELRVGNNVQCVGIYKESILRAGFITVDAEFILLVEQGKILAASVPLTPELLEACGFTKLPEQPGGYQGYLLGNDFELGFDKHNDRYYYECSNREGYRNECYVTLTSLHELQNLFFYISGGKELIYKPTPQPA